MELCKPQKHLGAHSLFICVLVVNLVAILAIDMYAPALPSMQKAFGVTAAYLNLTLFAYFATSALGVLVAGPLSDSVGRRPVLIGSTVLFALSSFGCAASPTIEVLVLFRVGQAVGQGAINVIVTALIQDSYQGEDGKKAMASLQSLILIGPAAAPFLGTFVLSVTDWRGIFLVLGVLGLICVILALLVSETHETGVHGSGTHERDGALRSEQGALQSGLLRELRMTGRNGKALLADGRFRSLALFMSVAGVPYFAFIAVISYILLDGFAMSYVGYSLIYAIVCAVSIVAPYIYVVLSRMWKTKRILRACLLGMFISFVLMAALALRNPWLLLLAFSPYALVEGIVRPLAFVVLLDQPESRVGAASSLINFLYAIITALATVLATLPWSSFIFGLVVIMGACAVLMSVLYLAGLRK